MPAAAMRGPPMPTRFTVGSSARRARHKVPPWRSPEASPAETMMTGRSGMATATREITAHDRDAGLVGEPHGCLPIDDEDLAPLHRESSGTPGRHRLEGGRTDGRQRLVREARSSDVATKILRPTHTAEHLLLPQLANEDDRADLGVAERAHHFLKVGERARDDPLGVRFDSGGCVEGE